YILLPLSAGLVQVNVEEGGGGVTLMSSTRTEPPGHSRELGGAQSHWIESETIITCVPPATAVGVAVRASDLRSQVNGSCPAEVDCIPVIIPSVRDASPHPN